MKILVLGSTGMIGSRIVDELVARGHLVTRTVRRSTADQGTRGAVVECDPREEQSVIDASVDQDVVISALGGAASGDPRIVAEVAPILLAAAEQAGVSKLLVVGGAGSLITGEGVRLIDRPGFPDGWKPGSQAQIDALDVYRAYDGAVNWTYFSPSDEISPGTRTARIEYGRDHLLFDDDGRSYVSAEDFAYAVAIEAEADSYPCTRVTVRSRT